MLNLRVQGQLEQRGGNLLEREVFPHTHTHTRNKRGMVGSLRNVASERGVCHPNQWLVNCTVSWGHLPLSLPVSECPFLSQ